MTDKLTVMVVGANGSTGRLVVELLLAQGVQVKAIARNVSSLAEHKHLTRVQTSVHDLTLPEMIELVTGCDAIVCCLGHNLTCKGMFGHPRRLVTDVIGQICEAINQLDAEQSTKVILMNTAGNSNQLINEKPPLSQRIVIGLLRALLPPLVDNEQAAKQLQAKAKQSSNKLAWVAVRPDGLVDETEVGPYEIHQSPMRNAIFDAGKTSRINVAHFICQLVVDEQAWQQWQGQMPVIYNKIIPN